MEVAKELGRHGLLFRLVALVKVDIKKLPKVKPEGHSQGHMANMNMWTWTICMPQSPEMTKRPEYTSIDADE